MEIDCTHFAGTVPEKSPRFDETIAVGASFLTSKCLLYRMPLSRVRSSFPRSLAPLRATCLCLAAALVPASAVESRPAPDFAIQSWDPRKGVPATVINDIQRARS